MSINVTLYQAIAFGAGYIFFQIIGNILDKKTKYETDYGNTKLKYVLLFTTFNIFCFLFIDKIKENRKIDYMKDKVYADEKLIQNYGEDMLSEKEYQEHLHKKRYISINKMKKNIKWKKLKEMVK